METRMPSKRALAVLDEPLPSEPINKALRITNKVRRAIDGMVNGDCKLIKDAAQHGGLDPASLSRALDKPHVAAYLRQRVLKRLGIAAARAGATKVELLDSANELVRDRSSTFVLGLADIAPAGAPALSVNIEAKAGFVIDISEPGQPMRIVSSTKPAAIDNDGQDDNE
jgi:hypothetical protein